MFRLIIHETRAQWDVASSALQESWSHVSLVILFIIWRCECPSLRVSGMNVCKCQTERGRVEESHGSHMSHVGSADCRGPAPDLGTVIRCQTPGSLESGGRRVLRASQVELSLMSAFRARIYLNESRWSLQRRRHGHGRSQPRAQSRKGNLKMLSQAGSAGLGLPSSATEVTCAHKWRSHRQSAPQPRDLRSLNSVSYRLPVWQLPKQLEARNF